jgi:hypothetical protein
MGIRVKVLEFVVWVVRIYSIWYVVQALGLRVEVVDLEPGVHVLKFGV